MFEVNATNFCGSLPRRMHQPRLLTLFFPTVVGREDEYLVNMQHTVIPSWYNRNGYVQSMATLIEKELAKFEKPEEVGFSFHP